MICIKGMSSPLGRGIVCRKLPAICLNFWHSVIVPSRKRKDDVELLESLPSLILVQLGRASVVRLDFSMRHFRGLKVNLRCLVSSFFRISSLLKDIFHCLAAS